jgi:hypothetical protein
MLRWFTQETVDLEARVCLLLEPINCLTKSVFGVATTWMWNFRRRGNLKVMRNPKYGWEPQLPDHRDHRLAIDRNVTLYKKYDLRVMCPRTLFDQGQLGSCTANAICSAIEFYLPRPLAAVRLL